MDGSLKLFNHELKKPSNIYLVLFLPSILQSQLKNHCTVPNRFLVQTQTYELSKSHTKDITMQDHR